MNEQQEDTKEQKASRKDFDKWYRENPGVENADIYDAFPHNPASTLRRWKMDYHHTITTTHNDTPHEVRTPEIPSVRDDTLSANNKTLMRGTPFSEKTFEGMTPIAVNKFLLNWHESKKPKEGEGVPNIPIVGTPVGSGRPTNYIDQFMTMDPKLKKISFVAPASVVFSKEKNKKEAENKWVQQ